MAYHETFWLAAATIGPVIALTNAVTYGRMLRLAAVEVPRAMRRIPPGPRRGHAVGLTMIGYINVFASFGATATITIIALHVLALGHGSPGVTVLQSDTQLLVGYSLVALLISPSRY